MGWQLPIIIISAILLINMYGYKDNRQVTSIRLFTYLIPLAILLMFILTLMLGLVRLDNNTVMTVIIALIGWPIAVDNVFLQINNSLKRKIEADAIEAIDSALIAIREAFSSTVTFTSDFVAKPMEPPENLWHDAAYNKHIEITEATVKMRKAFGKLYTALESYEISIIHLEHYYRYLTITIENFIARIDNMNSKFLLATTDWSLDEDTYKKEVAKFSPLREDWSTIATYSFDLRKMLQNELLGDIFKRELYPRKPLPNHGTTLDKIATKQEVQKMIDSRNEKLGLPKGLS